MIKPLHDTVPALLNPLDAGFITARFEIAFGAFCMCVDVELPNRGVSALVGVSGSGKSTFLKVIAGLIQPEKALIRIGEEVWQDSSREIFIPPNRRAVGFVFQEVLLFPHLSVRENIEYGMVRCPSPPSRDLREHWIKLLDIGHLMERGTRNLSGGESQRVAIARALFRNPKLLLLDEPISSLDEERKNEIISCLDRLHNEMNIPILYVSHSTEEVRRLASHSYRFANGRLSLAEGNSSVGLSPQL